MQCAATFGQDIQRAAVKDHRSVESHDVELLFDVHAECRCGLDWRPNIPVE
jgi:hypothetical protein